jgi:hypothetical protein
LEILRPDDTEEEIKYFTSLLWFTFFIYKPFQSETFDFSDEVFWKYCFIRERFAKDPNLRKMNGNRGSKHFIYINRTFFGLYNLMFDLKSTIKVNDYLRY